MASLRVAAVWHGLTAGVAGFAPVAQLILVASGAAVLVEPELAPSLSTWQCRHLPSSAG